MGSKPWTDARVRAEESRQEIVDRYKDGASIRAIAGSYPDATYAIIRGVLKSAEVPLRARGTPLGRPRSAAAPLDGQSATLKELRKMAEMTQVELAAATGMSGQRIGSVEHASMKSLKIRTLARQVIGCGARLRVVAEFDGAETLVLYDTYSDDA